MNKQAPKTRSKRITVTLREDIYEVVQEAADYSGVSVNAWAALTLGNAARGTAMARSALLEGASEAILLAMQGVDEDAPE